MSDFDEDHISMTPPHVSGETMDDQDAHLVAYRLGRVEKALETINNTSIARDKNILEKLTEVSSITKEVSQNTWRIQSLEQSRTNFQKLAYVMVTSVILLGLEVLFNIITVRT